MQDDVQKAGYCDGTECYYGRKTRVDTNPIYCGNRNDGRNCTLLPGHSGNHVNCSRNTHNRFAWENVNGRQ